MFVDLLERGMSDSGGKLCVGLDPHEKLVQERFGRASSGVGQFLRWAVEETLPHACAYKPNAAFYEAMGASGVALLQELTEVLHDAGRAVIFDAKRGDIASSAAEYAKAAADVMRADAITVVPYMGVDAVRPFVEKGLFAFLLALPSNPSAEEIACHGEPPVCVRVAEMAARLALEYPGRIGLVVGATRPSWVSAMHIVDPSLLWLVPGVGSQGADLGAFLDAADGHERIIVSVSRAILGSSDPGQAAAELKTSLRRLGE